MVWAVADQYLPELSVEIDGDGFVGVSEYRDYLAAGSRRHVASVQTPATVTLKSAGAVVAIAMFD